MKKLKLLFHILTTLSAALSCSRHDEDTGAWDLSDLSVSVSAPASVTRSLISGNGLEDGSEIGIFLFSENGSDYDGTAYDNIRFTASGSPEFQSWTPDDKVMLSASQGKLYAYYPYSEDITDICRIPLQCTSEVQTDYLYADPVTGLNNRNPNADIMFNHALAAVRLSISRGTYTGIGEITEISVKGDNMACEGILDAVEGRISEIEEIGTVITASTSAFTLANENTDIDILVIPTGEDSAIEINMIIDGEIFSITTESVTLQQSTISSFDIKVDNASINVAPVNVRTWTDTHIASTSISNSWNIALSGDTDNIILNHSIGEDGTVTITATPEYEDAEVNPVTIEGEATVSESVDEETGVRTITLSEVNSDVSIEFSSYSLWVTATYNITNISDNTRLLYTTSYPYRTKCSRMKIDGMEATAANFYKFSTIGEHTVKFAFPQKTIITESMFYSNENLLSLVIPEGVEIIGAYGIHNCANLESIQLPQSLSSISYEAMSYNKSLKSITLPDNLVMGYQLLQKCTSLEEVILPANLQKIPKGTFKGCSSLKQIIIPESVTQIDESAFENTGLTSICIPKNVTSIPIKMCYNCSALEHITLHSGITSIGQSAFQTCSSLSEIRYEGQSIGSLCLKLHEGIQSVEDKAFCECNLFSSLIIPSTLTAIGNGSFAIEGLTSVSVSSLNDVYETRDGFNGIIGKDTDILVFGCKTATNIPSSVTQIGDYAYYKIPITEVDMHDGITSIGNYAFYNATSLTTIISRALTPPVLNSYVFMNPVRWGYLYVYEEAADAYTSAWLGDNTSKSLLGYYNWKINHIN